MTFWWALTHCLVVPLLPCVILVGNEIDLGSYFVIFMSLLMLGFKSRSAASEAEFSAPEGIYSLFETRLAVVLAQPANSAFARWIILVLRLLWTTLPVALVAFETRC